MQHCKDTRHGRRGITPLGVAVLYDMSSSLVIIWVLLTSCIGVDSERRWMPAGTSDVQQNYSTEDYESDIPRHILVRHGAKVIDSTSTQKGEQYRDITVTVRAFNEVYILDLSLNSRLFSSNYIEKTITGAGEKYHNVNHTKNHCFYLGTVRHKAQSTAAISTCNGITGHFAIGNVSYHIEPQSSHLHGQHVVFRSLPNAKSAYRCGSSHIVRENLMKSTKSGTRVKRSFNWPQDEDEKDKVVEMYIVNDYSQYEARGYDTAAVFQRAKEIVNIASSAYQVLGIYLVLVGMEVWSESDKFPIDPMDVDSVLGNWYDYRMRNINPFHYNDNAVLLTNTAFTFGVVGKAMIGTICSNEYSGSVVCDRNRSAAAVGITMAHEIGHSFGLTHDSDSCSCVDKSGHCIMYATTNSRQPASNWSSCSTIQISNTFQQGGDLCLNDAPNTSFLPTVPTCGNGILETGEVCDCGKAPNEECNRACCNSTTCQLIGPATCAFGRCCDVSRCQIREVGTQCRQKSDDCDLAELCDGVQSICPTNYYKPDGTPCTVNQETAYCYQGRCRSHSSQCELVWGSGTRSSNAICYTQFNVYGLYYGNCGLNWLPSVTYIPCQQSDAMCGKLQCEDNQRTLAYYQFFYLQSSATIGSYSCHSVIFDYGLSIQDPGLVPNGAKCGDGKMCVSQKCIDVSSLPQTSCAENCSTDEVCNNVGQCQKIGSQGFIPADSTTTTSQTSTQTSTISSTTSSTTTSPTTSPSSTTTSTTLISTTSSTTSPTTSTKYTTTSTNKTPRTTSFGKSTTITTRTMNSPTSTTTSNSPTSTTTSTTISSTTSSTTSPITSTKYTTTSTNKTPRITSLVKSTTITTRTMNSDSDLSNEGAFGVYLAKSQTGDISPLQLDGALANRLSRYNFSTNSFRSSLISISQFLYTEICTGVLGSTTAQLRTSGAYPPLSFDWMSTAQNGVDSGCRGGVLSVNMIVRISIGQNGGGVYSSRDQKETSYSTFSVTDTMKYDSQLLCVFGAGSSSVYGPLPLLNSLVNPVSPERLYNAATTAYTCASDASAYFFSMSVGVSAGSTATVHLVISRMNYTFEMTRQNTRTTGTTTLARTVLVPCTSDARMILVDGEVLPGSNLISFTAFPYKLKTETSVSWAGYRTRDLANPGAITYDLWLVREEINFQVKNSVVQIPVSGYYYVYVSGGVGQGKPLVFSVLVNDNPLFGVTRTATDHNGIDTIGHGMVVLLSQNDLLRVFAATTAYSSKSGLHTSFVGMLLYQD